MEPAGPCKVGVKCAASKRGGVHTQIAGPACNADIAEPVISEMRVECADCPVPDNGEAGICRTQISVVKFALLQNFPKLQRDLAAMGQGGGKLHPSREILSKIQHSLTCRSALDFLYCQTFF